jgi:hypothetical protein
MIRSARPFGRNHNFGRLVVAPGKKCQRSERNNDAFFHDILLKLFDDAPEYHFGA